MLTIYVPLNRPLSRQVRRAAQCGSNSANG